MNPEIMNDTLEKQVFDNIYHRILQTKQLLDTDSVALQKVFQDRYVNALKALDEKRIRKYSFMPSKRSVWSVIGTEREYQILPRANFCSCNDFYFRVISHEI